MMILAMNAKSSTSKKFADGEESTKEPFVAELKSVRTVLTEPMELEKGGIGRSDAKTFWNNSSKTNKNPRLPLPLLPRRRKALTAGTAAVAVTTDYESWFYNQL